jgi:hypothetical protein
MAVVVTSSSCRSGNLKAKFFFVFLYIFLKTCHAADFQILHKIASADVIPEHKNRQLKQFKIKPLKLSSVACL